MRKLLCALFLSLFSIELLIAGADMDLVPMPKKNIKRKGQFIINGKDIFTSENLQCKIGVAEINSRLQELNVPSMEQKILKNNLQQQGIFILTVDNKEVSILKKRYSLSITKDKPGPQGYVINVTAEQVIIIGSDAIGALYGAYTLRQMLILNDNGNAVIPCGTITDWPDFKYRSIIEVTPPGTRATLNKHKKFIDILARFKINMMLIHFGMVNDLRNYTPGKRKLFAELNAYAIERGIYPYFETTTTAAYLPRDKDDVKTMDGYHWRNNYYTWTRDDLIKKTASRIIEFAKECNFKMLFLHPIDGGGLKDPEVWSKRGPSAEKRWKDDERWKASANIFNIWGKAIDKIYPELRSCGVFYPYVAYCADHKSWSGKIPYAIMKRNSTDYWSKMSRSIAERWIPLVWMADKKYMDIYRECWKDRPVWFYAHAFVSTGLFGTWHRKVKTDYYDNPGDILTLNGGRTTRYAASWLNEICTAEFTWNVNAPGAGLLKNKLYFDAENDFSGPDAIMKTWGPRACRILYGRKLGNLITPLFNSGIQPLYIDAPSYSMYWINKFRLNPLADSDPTAKTKLTKSEFEKLEDSPERMEKQVEALDKVIPLLDKAFPLIKELDTTRKRKLIFLYKRLPVWYMIAQARFACRKAFVLNQEGKRQEAIKILEQAIKDYHKNMRHIEQVMEKCAGEPDFTALDLKKPAKYPIAGITSTPDIVKKMLTEELNSIKVSLLPRRPSPIARVAIYKGYGSKGTKAYLDRFANVKTDIISSLKLNVLNKYDCIFMMQTFSINKKEFLTNLPKYVEQCGGGVLFQHDLCGFSRLPWGEKTPFPDIVAKAKKRKDDVKVKIIKRHTVTGNCRPDTLMSHMYFDHIVPVPGSKGIIIVADKDDDAVIVVGKAGKGKIVFDGNVNINKYDKDEELTGLNAVIAKGFVEWVTNMKLVRR